MGEGEEEEGAAEGVRPAEGVHLLQWAWPGWGIGFCLPQSPQYCEEGMRREEGGFNIATLRNKDRTATLRSQ